MSSDDLTNAMIDAEGEAFPNGLPTPEKTRAQRAKFQLQFMALMLASDRTEEAAKAIGECEELLNELIKEGH